MTGPTLMQGAVEQAGVSLLRPAVFPLLPEGILLKGEFVPVVSNKRRKQQFHTPLYTGTLINTQVM